MIKVYTEVLGFNNLMYRYMSLPNSLQTVDKVTVDSLFKI